MSLAYNPPAWVGLTQIQIINLLKEYDDAYFNENELITDAQYDAFRAYAQTLYLTDPYFIGVGASVRGGKIDLPYPMGSLDQVQIGEIEGWVEKNDLQNKQLVITEKLDGISAMVVYNEIGDLQIAYSRGDGIQGADITRHISRMKSIPQITQPNMVVRGELIIKKENFEEFKKVSTTRAGKEYKNARNALAGKMNASENPNEIYPLIDFVAYEIVNSDEHKSQELFMLEHFNFITVRYSVIFGDTLNDDVLTGFIQTAKEISSYELDGFVIDVDNFDKRKEMTPTKSTLNPGYAVKYKVTDASNIATSTVVEVEWNPSKHGYLKPRVKIEPVEIQGTTVQYATGFNAKFIEANGVGVGAKVVISRQGDVIPNIIDVVEPVWQELLPYGNWHWNDTKVDIILDDVSPESVIKQIADFFDKIGAPLLREKSILKLYQQCFYSEIKIINATREELGGILGKNGEKAYDKMHEILNDIPGHVLAGAYSNERGIGVRMMKKLFDAYEGEVFDLNIGHIMEVDGFDTKTAEASAFALDSYFHLLSRCGHHITIKEENYDSGNNLDGVKFCFTGYRDKQMQQIIEDAGGSVGSSVSKNTDYVVAKDKDSISGKAKKARDLGIRVIGGDELAGLLRGYGLKV